MGRSPELAPAPRLRYTPEWAQYTLSSLKMADGVLARSAATCRDSSALVIITAARAGLAVASKIIRKGCEEGSEQ